MQRFLILVMASMAIIFQSSLAFASGGGGGGGFRGGGGGFSGTSLQKRQRQVDQTYEQGKAIFTGRAKGEPSLEYCIAVEGEKVPLKRKSIKAYKLSLIHI